MSSELRPGDEFAGHRIEEEAGAGGMGVVYRATHLLLERTVALKLIAPGLARNPAFRSRFEREWRLLAALEHPNVIGIYEAGEVDDRPYLSMRWVAGGDLARRLRGTTGLEPFVALEILGQVAAALDAAHQRGVIHRDIKPANVLLEHDRAWLTDFGAGKDLEARDTRTQTGQWVGTVDYVAPELLDGATATARSDVYSLGCVLYETLTGRVPFPRDTDVATLWAHRFEPPPAGLGALDGVLARALAKQPKDRPASAGELIRAARAALAPRPVGADTVVTDAPPPARRRRRIPLLALSAAVLVGAGLVAGLLLRGSSPSAMAPAAATAKPPRVERIVLAKHATAGRVAADATFAYVLDGPNRRVYRVISSSRQVFKPYRLKLPPHDLALSDDGQHLWVTLEARQVADIAIGSGKITYVHTDIEARSIAVTSRDVVVMSPDGPGKRKSRLQRIDPATHRTLGKPLVFGGAPTDIDADGDRAVELTALPAQLTTFSPTLTKPQTIDIKGVDGIAAELLLNGGDGWLTDFQFNEVDRFDALDGKLLNKLKVGREPDGIASEGDVIWVAERGGMVDRIDPKTAKPVAPPLDAHGPLSGDIAVRGGVVWASGTNDVVRIEPREPDANDPQSAR